MKQILTVKGLVDFAYNKYKSKKAITLDRGYRKSINYFNYRFDIYSLARAINSKINSKKVAIISESRYEFFVTYLANVMLENTVIIIDTNIAFLSKINTNPLIISIPIIYLKSIPPLCIPYLLLF